MRPVTQEIYGVPRERVIGSGVTLRYVADEHGGTVVRKAEPEVLDDGPAKPTRIWSRVDVARSWPRATPTATSRCCGSPSIPCAVAESACYHHDAEREFAYDAGAERSIRIARERRWTIVSMRDDWKTVYDVGQ